MHSSDIRKLSACSQAAVSLLYPFVWQHVLVPMLPSKLLDMACAPIPFLIGVLEAHMPSVRRMPMEEVIFLDLDAGTLSATCVSPSSMKTREAVKLTLTLTLTQTLTITLI